MSEENTEENNESNSENQNTESNENSELAELKAEVARMREHQAKLLDEKKAEQAKATEAAAEAEAARLAKAEKEGDFKELLADSEKKRQELQQKLDGQREQSERNAHKAKALELAAAITSDTTKAGDFADKLIKRTKMGDDGLQVLNESGELTVSPVDTLIDELKGKHPYLVDSKASGGDARGSQNNNSHPATNEQAEAAKKKGDTKGLINARLQEHFNKGK